MALDSKNTKKRPHRPHPARDYTKLPDIELIGIAEMADWAGLSVGTFRNYVRKGLAPAPLPRDPMQPNGPNKWLLGDAREYLDARRMGKPWVNAKKRKGPAGPSKE